MFKRVIIKLFFWVLRRDIYYRGAWHDNLAMMAYDAGAEHHRANLWAGEFMRRLIGIDTYVEYTERTTVTVNTEGR